ncbi:MAG TPA: hypothetical protein VEV16_04495, partial [Daejeonella sp.]|nr:hypothetical protein [Daejeonella sp.]
MKSDQIFTVKELVYLFIISVLVISILIYLLPNDARTTVNHISIASSVFGFSAFFITLKQIHSLKQIALQTELAVNNKLRGYNKIIFLTELSSKISLISEIKGHLRKKQFEICVYRMDDFKRILANLNT